MTFLLTFMAVFLTALGAYGVVIAVCDALNTWSQEDMPESLESHGAASGIPVAPYAAQQASPPDASDA